MTDLPDERVMCHRAGFAVSCLDGVVRHKCQLWTRLRGTEPQSGQEVDKHGCADAWAPMLQVETTQQIRQLGAAIESLRNESVAAQERSRDAAERAIRQITGFMPEQPKVIASG